MFTKTLLIESCILLVFPIPYYDSYIIETVRRKETEVVYFYSEIATALMWLRFYFLVKMFLQMSIYNDAYSRKLCKYYGFEASIKYTLKCYIKLMPERACLVLMFFTVIIFAHILKIAEMPYFR